MSSRNSFQFKWAAATTKTLSSNSQTNYSDKIDLNADLSTEVWEGDVQVKADIADGTTLVAGDYVDVWVSYSQDDTDYDTPVHAQYLGRVDCYAEQHANKLAIASFPIRTTSRYVKLITKDGGRVATTNIVLSARLGDHRSA